MPAQFIPPRPGSPVAVTAADDPIWFSVAVIVLNCAVMVAIGAVSVVGSFGVDTRS